MIARSAKRVGSLQCSTYQLISGQVLPIQLPYNGNDARSVADRELA
jgi:hypothetical protein